MKFLFFTLTIGFGILTTSLYACSCIGQRTVKEEIKHSDAVVVGTIISKSLETLIDTTAIRMFVNDSTNKNGFPYETVVAKYRFVVDNIYKGRFKSDTIDVYTGIGGGDCGFKFEIGGKYIIYGENETYFGQVHNHWPFPKGKDIIWTYICLRTNLFDKDEIKEIEKYKKKKMGTRN